MKDFAIYTLARLGIFFVLLVVAMVVFWLANGREGVWIVWPVATAAIGSTIVSAYALRGLRERVALGVQERASRASGRFEEIRAKEDAADDEARRGE